METDRLFRLVPSAEVAPGARGGLSTPGMVRRLDSLFRVMATDYLLREQFVTSPSALIFDYVHGVQLSAEQASVSDQLIYSVMANRPLLTWLYDRAAASDIATDRNAFASEFARGAAQQGAHHVLVAMMRAATEGQHPVGLDEVLVPFLARRPVVLEGGGGDGGTGGGDGGTGGGDGGTGGGDGGTGGGDGGTGGGDGGTGGGDGGTGGGDGGTGGGDGGTGGGGTLTAITFTTFITGGGTTGITSSTSPFTHTGITRSPFTHIAVEDAPGSGEMFDPAYVLVSLDALFQHANLLREQGLLDVAFEA
ncbi:hypothetical protein [Kitasatospora sp. NPDC087314]|uniref:hypothetical protein n=1 Tax=Kitasatospora sp. NPDC087314 TaxID=3364068 RepID=UPI00381C64BB